MIKETNLDKVGAIVCEHVASRKSRIGRAVRAHPVAAEDSGWQFLCGRVREETPDKAPLWLVSEVVNLDPSIRTIITTEANVVFVRRDHKWINEK